MHRKGNRTLLYAGFAWMRSTLHLRCEVETETDCVGRKDSSMHHTFAGNRERAHVLSSLEASIHVEFTVV